MIIWDKMASVESQSKEECCKYMLIGFIYDVMRFEKQEETRQARYSDIQAKAYIFRVMLQGVWPAAYSRVLRVQRVFFRVMFHACNRTCESCFLLCNRICEGQILLEDGMCNNWAYICRHR